MPEIKTIEFINCRNAQCEDRVSEIEDKTLNYNEVLKEATKKKEQDEIIQQRLDDRSPVSNF